MRLKAVSLFSPITVINITCKTKSFFYINTLFQTRQTASRLLSHIKVEKEKKNLRFNWFRVAYLLSSPVWTPHISSSVILDLFSGCLQ